jgi:RecA/RadA recombinase
MSSLLDRLKKVGSVTSSTLAESSFFNNKEEVVTEIPALNIALSGKIDGGLTPGVLMVSGPSKSFKTAISLYMVSAYLKKYDDAICIFYDTEYGSTPEYFQSYNIDLNRVLHIPVEHIEQLKFDLVKKLDEIKKKERVIILIDSIGNAASKKELDDAVDEKTVADMSRAKALKSFWRIITPQITGKEISLIAINHVYMEIGMYPKAIVGGGTGGIYASNAIWIISKSQEKDGTEVVGFNFTINIEKSRTVIERSKIPLTVKFDSGIDKYSGLLDLALESGIVQKPSNGWYCIVDEETGEMGQKRRAADTASEDFLGKVLEMPKFQEFIKKKYRLTYSQNSTANESPVFTQSDDEEE